MHIVDIIDSKEYRRVMNLPQSKKSPISIFSFLTGGVLIVYGQSTLDSHPNNKNIITLVKLYEVKQP